MASVSQGSLSQLKHIKGIWTESPDERSLCEKAVINLKIYGAVEFEEGKYIHTFMKEDESHTSSQMEGNDLTLSGVSFISSKVFH